MSDQENIRETVRRRYASAATHLTAGEHDEGRIAEASACAASAPSTTDPQGRVVFGADLYGDIDGPAIAASLGCGVPTAVADLHPGEIVLDLGSGAGAHVLISARRVAPRGRAIGLDMTTEMLDLARRNATEAGVANVEFLHGYLEDRTDITRWTGCFAGALTEGGYRSALTAAGLIDIEIHETHRVHPSAYSAIIQAGKPSTGGE